MSFETFLLDHESVIRFGFFLGTFALMALWEVLAPLRVPGTSKAIRWPNHVMLAAMNVVLLRVLSRWPPWRSQCTPASAVSDSST